jgi:hypothetical protein
LSDNAKGSADIGLEQESKSLPPHMTAAMFGGMSQRAGLQPVDMAILTWGGVTISMPLLWWQKNSALCPA